MPALGSGTEESITLLPQRVFLFLHFRPGHLDVSDLPLPGSHGAKRNAVVGWSDEWTGRDDHVRQIRRRLDALPMDDEVLAVLNGFRDIAIAVEPATVGVEGN